MANINEDSLDDRTKNPWSQWTIARLTNNDGTQKKHTSASLSAKEKDAHPATLSAPVLFCAYAGAIARNSN